MRIDVSEVRPGMILSRPIYGDDSNVLLNEGTVLTSKYIQNLQLWEIPEIHIYDKVDQKVAAEDSDADIQGKGLDEGEILIRAKAAIVNLNKEAEEKVAVIKEVREKVKDSVHLLMEISKNTERVDFEKTQGIVDTFVRDLLDETNILLNLLEIRSLAGHLYNHSINVCSISLLIADSMGFSDDELRRLGIAALMHDVGMLKIPESVYNKNSALNDEEYELIKKHPIYSAQMLKSSPGFSDEVALIVYQHHERYDGRGYPKGTAGDEIHPYAQIITVADAFESMTNPRPYRHKMSAYEAVKEIIANSGRQFNPKVVKHFITRMAVYPIGSFVQLNTGQIAVVFESNKAVPLRPKIKLILDAEKNELSEKNIVDLSKNRELFIRRVVEYEEIFEKIKEINIFGR